MRAAITGGTGFIGSALVRKILDSGGQVAVISRPDSPNLWRLPVHPALTMINGSLEDLATVSGEVQAFGPEVFYHLGWIGVANRYRNDINQTANINITLESVRLASMTGCRRWVGAGSQGEYGPLNRRISEADAPEPTTLYGASKVAAWALANALGRQIGLEMVWARVFSTYGPGDDEGWMLPDVINQLLQGKKPALTLGEQAWDYLFVDDAAEALYQLGSAAQVSGIYNLGSGQSLSIRRIVEHIRDQIDSSLPLGFGMIPYRPDQVMHLEADITRIQQHTGWVPRVSFPEGIGRLIHWLRQKKFGPHES